MTTGRWPMDLDPLCLVLGKMSRDAAMDWDGTELERGGEKRREEGEREEKEGRETFMWPTGSTVLSKIFSILCKVCCLHA